MIRWITIAKFAAETGYTQWAVRKKIQNGKWPASVWHKAPDGHVLINPEEYEKWVLEGTPEESDRPALQQLRSTSTIRANGAKNGSCGNRPKQI
ncbi:excisionase [Burkholderia pseudomallei]|uniref:excisionase n=1 Tax=Burkholderia pseudomallei TaxID=28450 RepID=UPI001E344518|nr:excisionase [Burkholderia pseudomallei]